MKLAQFILIPVLFFLACAETPPVAPAPAAPTKVDTLYDTLVLATYVYVTDTVVEFAIDTVYEDSVRYSAVDMLEVGVLFAKRELWNRNGIGSLYFSSYPAICTHNAQVYATLDCDVFGVRGSIDVLQGNVGQGLHYFRAGLIYRSGDMADTASWELREIEVWR
jgi:hypothetical protein